MKQIVSLLFIILPFIIFAQLPQNYFSDPLKIPLILSGNFGELRTNHFHAGLDLKTQGRTGVDIHAVAEGYVSRIKISHHGYGKALYIKHPNGYTSVYAHLEKFAPKIEAYVKERQYKKESFTIELFPKKTELIVTQDEIVAISGNTGSSGGPHLHFEIRDAQSRPMNPLLFGIEIADSRKPLVNNVWLYPLSEDAQINGVNKPYRLKLFSIDEGILKTKPIHASGNIGVGLNTFDQQDGARNKNGVFKINTIVNGSENFELQMKRFSFFETRYLNRMIDYAHFKKNKSRIVKLFIQDNNPLSIYSKTKGNGVITVLDQLSYNINVSVEDFEGNAKQIIIPVEGKQVELVKDTLQQNTQYVVSPTESFEYQGQFAKIEIPQKAVYEPVSLEIEELPNNRLKVHNNTVPLHKYMTVSFSLDGQTVPKQCYVGSFQNEQFPEYEGSKIVDGKNYGSYTRVW